MMKQFTRIYAGAGTEQDRGEKAALLADALQKLAPYGVSVEMDEGPSRFAHLYVPDHLFAAAEARYSTRLDGGLQTR